LPWQVVWPGAHTPVQTPLTQVWLEQATAVPQVPLAAQVWTPLPEHCVVPGTQTPVHPPLTHADATHAVAVLQVPLAVQVS
jgi:hypothetical protein